MLSNIFYYFLKISLDMKPTKIQIGAKILPLHHNILSDLAEIHEMSISESVQKLLEQTYTPTFLSGQKSILVKRKKEVESILASNPNHEPSKKKIAFYQEKISNLELYIKEIQGKKS